MDTGTGGQSKSCEETRLMRKVKFWEGLETGGRYFLLTIGDDDGDHDLHDVNVGVDEEGQVVWGDRNRELNCSLQTRSDKVGCRYQSGSMAIILTAALPQSAMNSLLLYFAGTNALLNL